MNLRDISCEDGRWLTLAHDRVKWWVSLLSMLSIRMDSATSVLGKQSHAM